MRPLAFLALGLAAAGSAAAQSTENYGSVYSGFGLGQRADAPTSQGQMLGGATTAIGGQFATPETPALLSDLGLTAFAANLQVQGVRGRDALGNESELVSGTLGGLRLGFPISSGRLGLGLSYTPYSRVQYEVFNEGRIDLDDDPSTTTPYRVQYERRWRPSNGEPRTRRPPLGRLPGRRCGRCPLRHHRAPHAHPVPPEPFGLYGGAEHVRHPARRCHGHARRRLPAPHACSARRTSSASPPASRCRPSSGATKCASSASASGATPCVRKTAR